MLCVSKRHASKRDTIIVKWDQIRIVVEISVELVNPIVWLLNIYLPLQYLRVKLLFAKSIDQIF